MELERNIGPAFRARRFANEAFDLACAALSGSN
jgi:hypothetical protein